MFILLTKFGVVMYVCGYNISPRAEANLIPRNYQMSYAYFWKGTIMGYPKTGILNVASGIFSPFLVEN